MPILEDNDGQRFTMSIDVAARHRFLADAEIAREAHDLGKIGLPRLQRSADLLGRHEELCGKAIGLCFEPPVPILLLGVGCPQILMRAGELLAFA